MLTYGLTCAFVLLLAVYYLVLKQKYLIRTLLKYKDLNPVALLEVVGTEVSTKPKSTHISESYKEAASEKKIKGTYDIPGPLILPIVGTRWQYPLKYSLCKIHEAYADMNQKYGDIVLEEGNGHPYLHLFDRNDIDKVSISSKAKANYLLPELILSLILGDEKAIQVSLPSTIRSGC